MVSVLGNLYSMTQNFSISIYLFIFMLRLEPRVSWVVSKHFTTELQTQPTYFIIIIYYFILQLSIST